MNITGFLSAVLVGSAVGIAIASLAPPELFSKPECNRREDLMINAGWGYVCVRNLDWYNATYRK